jgi:hypothetical protein
VLVRSDGLERRGQVGESRCAPGRVVGDRAELNWLCEWQLKNSVGLARFVVAEPKQTKVVVRRSFFA